LTRTSSNAFDVRIAARPSREQLVELADTAHDGPTWLSASLPLSIDWAAPGGDYLDRSLARNGTDHFATATIDDYGERDLTFDVGSLVERLLPRNTGIYLSKIAGGTSPSLAAREHESMRGPALRVVTSDGTFECACVADAWVAPSAGSPIGGSTLQAPAMLKFDLGAITGSVVSATLTVRVLDVYSGSLPVTIAVDYLDMPRIVTDPALEVGDVREGIAGTMSVDADLGGDPRILWYSAPGSRDAIDADFQSVGLPADTSYVDWPELGIPAVRVGGSPASPSILSLHTIVTPPSDPPLAWQRGFGSGYEELYFRYVLYIDPDVRIGHAELGTKLPGLNGTYEFFFAPSVEEGGWSARTEHGQRSFSHPGLYRFAAAYFYGHEWPLSVHSGQGKMRWCNLHNVCLRDGQRYSIEQQIKLNTPNASGGWNRDGVLELWIDGVLVHQELTVAWRADANAQFQSAPFTNVYHGGNTPPSAPIHYELSGFAVAEEYIGPARRRT
jgi:hypothetical protein